MFDKIIYLFRFLIKVKFKKNINSISIVLLQKNVKIIVEKGAKIYFGKNTLIKNNTIIYAKENSEIIFGDNSSTGHHSEISVSNSVKIGDDVIMGAYTYITDSNHSYEDKSLPIRKQAMTVGKVEIENNIWLGRNVMILKDSKIGSNSVVAAGSIVTKEFDGNVVIGGIPAKIIKGIY